MPTTIHGGLAWGVSVRALSPVDNAEGVTGANPSRPAVHVTNVLVPLDGSELALQAMPTARVLAQRLGADLHTVTVADGEDDGNAPALSLPPR